jgi:tRNA(fMet)-specific endonuclease VapC
VKCLDSDLLIAILRGNKEAYNKAAELDEAAKEATTSINAFEIFFGAIKSSRKNENMKEASELVESLNVIPLDLSSSRKAAEIYAKLATEGKPIDFRDAMIAGIAIENHLTLVTRNKSHFSRVEGLSLETW